VIRRLTVVDGCCSMPTNTRVGKRELSLPTDLQVPTSAVPGDQERVKNSQACVDCKIQYFISQ
jgi:hypothetical protein